MYLGKEKKIHCDQTYETYDSDCLTRDDTVRGGIKSAAFYSSNMTRTDTALSIYIQ
jgi:predicted acyl esterase